MPDDPEELEVSASESSEYSEAPSSVLVIVPMFRGPGEPVSKRPNLSNTFSDLDSLVISLKPRFSREYAELSFFVGKKHTNRPSFAQTAPHTLATGTITLALTGRMSSELIARS
jgi:hypothetical protein